MDEDEWNRKHGRSIIFGKRNVFMRGFLSEKLNSWLYRHIPHHGRQRHTLSDLLILTRKTAREGTCPDRLSDVHTLFQASFFT